MGSADSPPGGAGGERRDPEAGRHRGQDRGPDAAAREETRDARGKDEPGERSPRQEFEDTLSNKTARKLKARQEGDRGIWFGLGMMGLVGWSVAIPTVAGIAAGIWLDRRSPDPGGISWTLTGLVVGVFLGCLNAWIWVQRELEGRG